MKKQIIEMRTARGIGILLVSLGHSLPLKNEFSTLHAFIYTFHMALFFFMAGFFAHSLTTCDSIQSYWHIIKKKIEFLCVPYIVISLIYGVIKYIVPSMVKRPVILPDIILDVLFFPADNPAGFLWFLYTLIIMVIITPIVVKIKWPAVLSVALVLNMLDVEIEFGGINFLCKYYFFYALSLTIYNHREICFVWLKKKYLFPIALTLMILFFFVFPQPSTPIVNVLQPIIGGIAVLSLCFGYSQYLPTVAMSILGRYSYEIYLLQFFFIFPLYAYLSNYLAPQYIVLCTFIAGLLGPLLLAIKIFPNLPFLAYAFGSYDLRNKNRSSNASKTS